MTDEAERSLHHMNTAWHPLLVVLLEHLLPREWYRVLPEVQLTREPQRIDVVVVRLEKRTGDPPPPTHLRSVLDGLRAHNIVHFKGPSDELEREDALQILGYCAQYMALESVHDPSLLCVRVVAPSLTPRFADQVARMDGELAPTALRGVHEGRLGVFALRVIETAVAYPQEHEHLLYTVSPAYVAHPEAVPSLDDKERLLFYLLCQSVARFRNDPRWRTIMKDAPVVEKLYSQARRDLIAMLTLEDRLEGVAPERIARALKVEDRLAGLTPEQIARALKPEQALLTLADEALRALADDDLATLSQETQAAVRARRGR